MDTTIIEEWRPVAISEFSTSYEVSNLGRVRSLDRLRRCRGIGVSRIKGRIMRINVSQRGYPSICLRAKPVMRFVSVHRLVAMAFVPNPENLPEVNHIDLVKTNNAATNLEWVSRLDNYLHAASLGIMPFKRALTDGAIFAIKRLYDEGFTQSQIARRYGIDKSTVSRLVWGKRRRK